jgi:uncharacterized protein involved in cysteine biosynthesis
LSDASRAIAGALRRAIPILFTGRVIALATLPLLIAPIVWIGVGVLAWHPLTDALVKLFGSSAPTWWQLLAVQAIAVLMLAALAIATALAAIAVLAMPVIVKAVALRHFPTLRAQRGGTVVGSARNAMLALLAFVPLWLLTLPLLVVPPLYVASSLVLNAWLSQRMFRYDALAEHASAAEIDVLLRKRGRRLMGMGLVLSPLSLVPIVNILVLPIYAGVAFAELCLAELAQIREGAGR